MNQPQGSLTAAQVEIMDVVWASGSVGATVAEIWQTLGARREVARTTVLTMVRRLENRGWLTRREGRHGRRFVATDGKEKTSVRMAVQFVAELFNGSASELVRSLLGSHQVTAEELRRLRELIDSTEKGKPS